MKLSSMAAALLACGVACPALAGDAAAVEPGLRLAWTFGADAPTPPALSLGLYPSALGWRRLWADLGVHELERTVERPAVVALRWSDDTKLQLMGLPLDGVTLGLNADDGDSKGGGFLKPALIVLAAGAAAALTIAAAGDAAEDSLEDEDRFPEPNDGGNDNGDNDGGVTGVGSGGVGCVNGDCVVPCDSTPANPCDGG